MSNIDIEYKGVKFDIEFYYQPEEPMVRYYADGSGYPGCPAEIEISEIKHNGTCFMELLENDLEDLEDIILEKILE